jgi:hypothetical protein
MMQRRAGGCLCGSIRYEVVGEPLRVGICHCMDCRKDSGSVFTVFAIWPRDHFRYSGEPLVYEGRGFCGKCGSRLFNVSETEAEIHIGSLDVAPTDLEPQYELWVKRREPWLAALPGLSQYDEDRKPQT